MMRMIPTMFSFFKPLGWVGALVLVTACASRAPYDYTEFRQRRPRSILVLPPINESTDVRGTYSYLSTVTRPVAEMGYYVFPVAMIDRLMKENGLPTPGDMHQAPLKKIAEIINPDAVMYITLKQYGSQFQVTSSRSVVKARGKLVDTKSGIVLWEGEGSAVESSNQSGGLLENIVGAVVAQAVNSGTDRARSLAGPANENLFWTKNKGLLHGPYHPEALKNSAP